MDAQANVCVNCSAEVNTTYCSNCGQKNPPRKITLLGLYHDFQSRIYGFDGMFPRTIKDLTINPGKVAQAFISGNRVKYVGPVGYLFLMITIFLILASLYGVEISEFINSSNSFMDPGNKGQQEMANKTSAFFNEYMRLMSFVVAFFLIITTWLFYRKSGNNFLEMAVVVFYNNGHLLWMSIILLTTFKFFGFTFDVILMLLISIAYYVFTCVSYFRYQTRWKIAVKAVFSYVLSYVIYIIVFIVGFVIYALQNPDFLQKLKN